MKLSEGWGNMLGKRILRLGETGWFMEIVLKWGFWNSIRMGGVDRGKMLEKVMN